MYVPANRLQVMLRVPDALLEEEIRPRRQTPGPAKRGASCPGLLCGCHTAAMALYGLTGAFLAAPGKRDELVAHMLEAVELMGAVPGCLMYLVSTTEDVNEVAITELWTDEAAHEASLRAPGVADLIGRARPVIAGMSGRSVLTVLGGKGLPIA